MNRSLLYLILVAALTLVGCSHHKGAAESATPEQGATLDVDNYGFIDCDIYVLHDGIRDRLGTVLGTKKASFHLRASQLGNVGTIQLVAHPIGSNINYTSEIVSVHDGQNIEWTLADDLNRSSVAVY